MQFHSKMHGPYNIKFSNIGFQTEKMFFLPKISWQESPQLICDKAELLIFAEPLPKTYLYNKDLW
jgi:hypothetical protein